MAPSCAPFGILCNEQGAIYATYMCDMWVGLFRVVPLFAMWYAISLPIIPMRAYTIVSNNIQPFHNLSPVIIGARIIVHNFKHFKEGEVFYSFCGNMLLFIASDEEWNPQSYFPK